MKKNIVISIFDEKFINYALRMYKSYRFFDKKTKLYAGSINLSDRSKNKLISIGVEILESKTKKVPKHLQLCDLTVRDYIYNIDWDNLMWIDADTIILKPINYLFEENFDFVGHGGDIDLGHFFEGSRDCYPYRSTWITRKIENNILVEECKWGKFFAMGLWVAKNKNIIDDLYQLYEENKNAYFEGDICSELLNKKYKCKQLNGFEWSIGTLQNKLLYYKKNKVILRSKGQNYYPNQFGYSRINDERPKCAAIEKFYKNMVLKFI